MSDQLVAEDATYTTHNKRKRRTFMPSAGFEPAITALERPQMYALDRTATGIVLAGIYCLLIHGRRWLRNRPLKIYAARSSKTLDSTAKPTLWHYPDDPNLTSP